MRPTFFDYLIVVLKWKKLIIGVSLLFVAMAVMVVLLMPSIYLAETRILPPDIDNTTTTAQLLSQLGGLSLPGGLIAKKSLNDLYVGLLRSRTVLDRMVDRFGLIAVYRVKYREEARNILLSVMRVDSDKKSSLITIGVEDRDPQRAADMASALVEELMRITQEIALTEATQRRLFYESELKEAKAELIGSEDALKGFQEKTGTIEMKEQAKAIIESVAKLRAQVAAKEVNLKVLRTYTTPQNPDLQKIEDELKGMKEQLVSLEEMSSNPSNRLMSTGNVLEAETDYVRKIRDLKHNEILYELLAKQYEIARMDESRNSKTIQVIDKAVPPDKRARPKRTKMVAFAALIGALSGVLLAFNLENLERLSGDPENRAMFDRLKYYAAFHR